MTVPVYPLQIDGRGRTTVADQSRAVADLVEAVLFTAPGERVNRPDFGCGLNQLVFAPVDVTAVGTAELQVRSGLQRWLGGLIEVSDVSVDLRGSSLTVDVAYLIRTTGTSAVATFEVGA